MLREEEQAIRRLKAYYKKIFSKSFGYVKSIHIKELPVDRKYLSMILSRFSGMEKYLYDCIPEHSGIYDGNTAYLIWSCYYNKYIFKCEWNDQTNVLWQNIRNAIHSKRLTWDFQNGACGIGWGILYLYFHKMIKECITDEIAQIDEYIKSLELGKIDDYSFSTGLGGFFAYLSLRMRFGNNSLLTVNFQELADLAAMRILNNDTDLASHYYAMLYLSIRKNGIDANDALPDINEWLEAPNFIPNNSRFWNIALMDGCFGTFVKAILIQNNLKLNPNE